jgi:hypothetical protein
MPEVGLQGSGIVPALARFVAAETIPTFLGGLCELVDHGDGGFVREATPRADRSMPDGGERTFDRVCRA